MATNYKVLGQQLPAVTTNVDLYTVPASTQTIVSTISVANVTASAATYNIYVRVAGAAAATSQALVYGATAAANSTTAITIGLTLNATDVLTVQSGTASAITFQAFGSENS